MDIRSVKGLETVPDHSATASAWYIVERNEMREATTGTYLEYITEAEIDAGTKLERHYHNNYEFFYVLSGSGTMEIEGEEQPVTEGSLITIGPNQEHSVWSTVTDAPIRLLCIGLNLSKDGTSTYHAADRQHG
jgi:mannose-6-phosphate isomerase-like protein (cupin superfamily)